MGDVVRPFHFAGLEGQNALAPQAFRPETLNKAQNTGLALHMKQAAIFSGLRSFLLYPTKAPLSI